ncbi:MAG: DsrE family protein [Methylococcaceae bacterium]|nr:DsrE family protein [Methylococcaceae bacterium]
MNKTAIFIFSDPKNGGEEALGRAFNGLAAAYDIKQSGGEVSVTFQGAGTRWASLITQADHPLHGLYNLVKGNVVGVSCGCADVFGAAEEAKACGFEVISENPVPGTSGLASFGKLLKFGTTILTF